MISHARSKWQTENTDYFIPIKPHTVSINKTAPILKILLLICFDSQKSVIFLCNGLNIVLLQMSIYLLKPSKQNKDKVLRLELRNVLSQVKTFDDVMPFNFTNSGDTVLSFK